MAKLFKLPVPPKAEEGKPQVKPAFPLKGQVKVGGVVFTDGQCLVADNDTAALLSPKLTRFYGVTVENVQEAAPETAKDDGSLAANATKK